MQNISFNDFGYVIKPLQPISAIYGAPSFTGNLIRLNGKKKIQNRIWSQ